MPKKPEAAPTAKPVGSSRAAMRGVTWTSVHPASGLRDSIETPTPYMATAKASSSVFPFMALPNPAPISAPTLPLSAKGMAQDHLTVPLRAWSRRLMRALRETATALVPMATWGSSTPTR